MGLLKEFRHFAVRGNVMDMAVGIMIGGAFGLIVRSLINDLVMPIIGLAGNADFSNLYIPLDGTIRTAMEEYAAAHDGAPLPLPEARALGPVFAWGNFVTVSANFLILAVVIFVIVRMVNRAKEQYEEEKKHAPPAALPADVALLSEIRDLLQGSEKKSEE